MEVTVEPRGACVIRAIAGRPRPAGVEVEGADIAGPHPGIGIAEYVLVGARGSG
jgi:hypothetical protein